MALKVSKADVWAGDLRDQPGGLADVLDQVATGGASLQFVIARRNDARAGIGQVFLTPIKGKKTQQAARMAGLAPAQNVATLRVEGADRPGLGSRIAEALADAGINVRGVSAAVIGRQFVAYIGLDSPADVAAATRALKSVDRSSAKPKRPARAGRRRK